MLDLLLRAAEYQLHGRALAIALASAVTVYGLVMLYAFGHVDREEEERDGC